MVKFVERDVESQRNLNKQESKMNLQKLLCMFGLMLIFQI